MQEPSILLSASDLYQPSINETSPTVYNTIWKLLRREPQCGHSEILSTGNHAISLEDPSYKYRQSHITLATANCQATTEKSTQILVGF